MKRFTDKQLQLLAKKHKETAALIHNGRELGKTPLIKKLIQKSITDCKDEKLKKMLEDENVQDIMLGITVNSLSETLLKYLIQK